MTKELSQKTFDKLVDIVLEHSGTPRKDLFEYPYNEFESRDLIAKAQKSVKRIVKVIDAEQPKD